MPLSLKQILFERNCKILDALSSIAMASAMQFLIFWTYFGVKREIQLNPDLAHSSYKFIFEGMVVMVSFFLSFIFFVLALVKYRDSHKKKESLQYKYIALATKVLLLIVGIVLMAQICLFTYNAFLPHFRSLTQYLSGFYT
jgi:amino acid transporter